MDVTPTSTAPKRIRANAAVKKSAVGKTPRPTLTAKRKKSKSRTAVEGFVETESLIDLHGMIATAAFFRAAERGFAPGHDIDDWLEAERQIKAQRGV